MGSADPSASIVASALQYLPLFGAFVGGMAFAGILFWLTRRIRILPPWTIVAVVCLAIIGLVGAFARQIDFVQAMLIVLLGSAALVAMVQAIDRLQRGESIELQSHWGGLGGALGGWRLSPVTSLLVLALVLAGGAIGVGVGNKKGEPDSKAGSPADAGKGAPKGGAGGQTPETPKPETPPPNKG